MYLVISRSTYTFTYAPKFFSKKLEVSIYIRIWTTHYTICKADGYKGLQKIYIELANVRANYKMVLLFVYDYRDKVESIYFPVYIALIASKICQSVKACGEHERWTLILPQECQQVIRRSWQICYTETSPNRTPVPSTNTYKQKNENICF